MSQMSANLTPCTPKAASMKGRLHVPRARPNEHPAMHQNDSRFDVRRSWQFFLVQCIFPGSWKCVALYGDASTAVVGQNQVRSGKAPVSRACSRDLRLRWESLHATCVKRALHLAPAL